MPGYFGHYIIEDKFIKNPVECHSDKNENDVFNNNLSCDTRITSVIIHKFNLHPEHFTSVTPSNMSIQSFLHFLCDSKVNLWVC